MSATTMQAMTVSELAEAIARLECSTNADMAAAYGEDVSRGADLRENALDSLIDDALRSGMTEREVAEATWAADAICWGPRGERRRQEAESR